MHMVQMAGWRQLGVKRTGLRSCTLHVVASGYHRGTVVGGLTVSQLRCRDRNL